MVGVQRRDVAGLHEGLLACGQVLGLLLSCGCFALFHVGPAQEQVVEVLVLGDVYRFLVEGDGRGPYLGVLVAEPLLVKDVSPDDAQVGGIDQDSGYQHQDHRYGCDNDLALLGTAMPGSACTRCACGCSPSLGEEAHGSLLSGRAPEGKGQHRGQGRDDDKHGDVVEGDGIGHRVCPAGVG